MSWDDCEAEIYLKNADSQAVIDWLHSVFPELKTEPPRGKTLCFSAGDIPIRLIPEAAGKAFTCLWFKQRPARWDNDIACAREAFATLKVEIRCADHAWQEGDDPDLWWRIDASGEGNVIWPD